MNIILLLHIYQPESQHNDILQRVLHESYYPILNIVKNNKKAKIVLNASGVLFEQYNIKDQNKLVDNISKLVLNNKIELTASAAYHSILPLLNIYEIKRQILLNNNIYSNLLPKTEAPSGFFPPEMAVNNYLLNILSKLNYKWCSVPQLAIDDAYYKDYGLGNAMLRYKETYLLPRNKHLSGIVLSSEIRSASDLKAYIQNKYKKIPEYTLLVMDGETFGHHRVGFESFLNDLFNEPFFNFITPTSLIENNNLPIVDVASINACTWTNTEQDFFVTRKKSLDPEVSSFILWKNPENPIHTLQWELLDYVTKVVNHYKNKNTKEYEIARSKLDRALASDHFWWASANPWWSLEMIESGAFYLKDVLASLDISTYKKNKADTLYRQILDIAFEWHRSGKIRELNAKSGNISKTPMKYRTHLEWFNQLILEFEDEMNKCAKERRYEASVKWRDAIYKLHLGTDHFDLSHVVDELWAFRNIPEVKPFFDHSYSEFSEFAKKHMLGFKNEASFNKWKKRRNKKYLRDKLSKKN